MRKQSVLLAGVIMLVLGLGACGSSEPGQSRDAERNGGELVHLPDGTSVMCVFNSSHGVDCDWSRRGREG